MLSDISLKVSGGYMHFMQSFRTGPLYTTTVFDKETTAGKFKAVHSSAVKTVSQIGLNTFAAHIRVRRGDVLALSNATSGIYMAAATPDNSIHYFSSTLADGSTGKPDASSPSPHLILSAHVKF